MRDVNGGWRIDRRTFLKGLGIGATGLVLGVPLSGLRPGLLAAPVAAASDPIADLALALQFDLERIFHFVSEEIRYEPYAGLLRGPEGTLMARAGNSADQASLMAALLQLSAIPYRYAFGRLDDATADSILSGSVTDVPTARQDVLDALTGAGEGGRPIVVPEPDAEARAKLEAVAAGAQQVVDWARQQTALTVADIETTLRSAGIAVPGAFSGIEGLERDQHAWLQASSGPGWLDLDASLPGALPGDAPTVADTVGDALGDELRHAIHFAIIGETVSGGALREEILLEASDFADALGVQPIGVMNMDPEGLKGVGVSIVSAVEGGTPYVPCLVLGDTVFVGARTIRFAGGDGAGAFGDAAASPGISDGEPTAEWVQVTISSPGAEPVVLRRPIFDRIGPAARAAGSVDVASLAPAELVRIEPDGPLDYMPAQTTHWFTVHTGIVGGEALGEALQRSETDEILAGLVHGYHVAREACSVELAMPDGVRPFVAAPNLVSLTVTQELGDDGSLLFGSMLDIWHRSFGVLPNAETTPSASPTVVAGVISHVAERLIFGEAMQADPASATASVGAVFDAARREGVALRVVRDADEAAMLPYEPDALARLRASLATGRIAVVPERAVRIGGAERSGWWLLDPSSGVAVDQLDAGGGDVTGYGRIVIIPVRAAPAMLRLGKAICFVVGFSFAIALGISGLTMAASTQVSGPEGYALLLLGAAGTVPAAALAGTLAVGCR